MDRFFIACVLGSLCSSGANAASCSVQKWSYIFGQQTNASMIVGSGASCQASLNSPTSRDGTVIQTIKIGTSPRNGTAIAQGLGLAYQSKSGFKGEDSFSFLVVGRGQKVATVRMSVTVTAPEGSPVPSSGPIRLLEYTPWLTQNRGPDKALGAIYYIRGLATQERVDDRHRVPQFFLTSLSEAGWDIFYAKYPHDLAYPGHEAAHKRVAEFVSSRVTDLKRDGYRRVILGGRSWGAWVTMVAEQRGDLAADALFLTTPATYGRKTTQAGRPNLFFPQNRNEFVALIKSVNKPVVVIFFSGDEWDPGGRGKLVEEHVRTQQLAHVLIDNPGGFKGHFADWLPIFDYVFGKCLELFFETLSSQRCELPALSASDFRSIMHRSQIPDFDANRISTPESLIGRSYVIYSAEATTSEVTHKSAHAIVRQTTKARVEEKYEFRQGKFCQGKQCEVLIRWDDKRIIAFDPNTGATTSWWIEK